MWVKDKIGQRVYVTFTPDVEPNKGGLYCETFTDDRMEEKIDDFCIHSGDCEMTREGIEGYIADYYKDTELDLNYNFYKF